MQSQLKELGSLLKQARKTRGLTQTDVGAAVKYMQPVISRFEKGLARIPAVVLEGLIDTLEVAPSTAATMRRLNDFSQVDHLGTDARLKATPRWFRDVVAAEREATAVLSWTGERISGQLQCESYMLEQFNAHGLVDVDDAVSERLDRGELLTRYPERAYDFLLSESALLRLVRARTVNPYVALDQIKHLLGLTEKHPWIGIRVVPFGTGLYVPPDLTIFKFAGDRGNFSYGETSNGIQRSNCATFQTDLSAWESLSSVALTAQESRDLLDQAKHGLATTRMPTVTGTIERLR
ncbi:helix-turn-helix transcriptional regulator [Amycolatopsis carbonis]|uniref:Helix-turn-helix transcriptional regulator n=1 Tax=Amycolatopsis carbonis TaxID=715471 RepID=A0A9Y2IJT3_9PSEU|nr:helix-turn-helix transcriptional regulator [Amycolatopsis sp. 2-15]WIX81650.1 helix-turn-helix transcriptional regulator [Amycolatopsis sp. 2-15]